MKVAGFNLGCKVNKYELDAILSDFETNGFEIVDFDDVADVYIVSTCAVTSLAEKKSRKYINRTKKQNPNAITVALGCYIQREFNSDKDENSLLSNELLNNIDIFIGTEEKSKVFEYVMKNLDEKKKEAHLFDVIKYDTYENQKVKNVYEATRAYVKIQDGCNNFCSYCIIPYTRGRERSRKIEDAMEEIHLLEEKGFKEIVLTGIEVAAYGRDLDEDISLIDVIEKVASETSIERIRLSSLEQNIITDEFMERLSKIDKFCPHFHLSLQSGSDGVLERMNRKYDTEKYYSKIDLIRKYMPYAAITTDIIVGFPEETEEEFEESCEFAKKVKFANIHIFPYSIRTGTVAAKKEQVPEEDKARREKVLENVKIDSILNFNKLNEERVEEVLFEQEVNVDGVYYYTGHTKNFIKTYVKSDKDITNKILKVKLIKSFEDGMNGEIVWED
ncbi:MAG: tRNA (N(6)-L-threonylcarbamoyladenosine(37)-C(2))-methylthiotransferase MtaB [Clostridia bacterium]|nr:tRNA (N(6)-L-threonylcarbamoyladenosine(37)-C(2))-methylthiotransferase MtaB [Clostridia bacterium]